MTVLCLVAQDEVLVPTGSNDADAGWVGACWSKRDDHGGTRNNNND